jgi:hypothetical protein
MPDVRADERWITVDGRRWRATDPSIPPKLRQELVDELMAGRRAVAAASRSDGGEANRADASGAVASGADASEDRGEALRDARRRVHAAKVALGERGEPWWLELTDDALRPRIEAVIDALTRHRAPDRSICPSDAARVAGGSHWRRRMDLVRDVAADMAGRDLIEITQKGSVVHGDSWRGPVRLRRTEAPTEESSAP